MTSHQAHASASAGVAGPQDQARADGAAARRRLQVNIAPAERAGRIVLGVAAVIEGAVLLASASAPLAVVLETLLIAAGLDLAVTGALGHCPLYRKLGHQPLIANPPRRIR